VNIHPVNMTTFVNTYPLNTNKKAINKHYPPTCYEPMNIEQYLCTSIQVPSATCYEPSVNICEHLTEF